MTNIEINFPEMSEDGPKVPVLRDGGWKWLPGILAGIALLAAGMLVILGAAILDAHSVIDSPWNTAFILFDIPDDLPSLESYPVQARLVSREEELEDDAALKMLETLVNWERFEQPVRLSDPEMCIALDLPEETLDTLLASGRLPEPGKAEVLAGSLARDDAFYIDDVAFTVVGRLKRSVSGFLFAYMLPHGSDFQALFAIEGKAAEGLLVIAGDALLEAGVLPEHPLRKRRYAHAPDAYVAKDGDDPPEAGEESEEELFTPPPYTGGVLMAQSRVTHLAMLGLVLAALGGFVGQFFLFKMLRARGYRPIQAILDEATNRPVLFVGMHVFFYGVFFYAMYASLGNPLITYRITQYIEAVFREGGLGYIGAAYASGNVSLAAWTTFYNNYIEQTLGLTFLISLFPIPLGLIKNALSFLLVGGAMAPMWVGASQAYMLHSITMVLELQAYIVACFAITAWPLHLLRGARMGQLKSYIKSGLLMLFSAAILTGAMLGIASVYEAFTLIRMLGP